MPMTSSPCATWTRRRRTLALSPRFALGSLRALGALQADGYDDARNMQPGKIEHEIRHGELAALHLVPHTPYYGTHQLRPALPDWLPEIRLEQLTIGDTLVDLTVSRLEDGTHHIDAEHRRGKLDITLDDTTTTMAGRDGTPIPQPS